MSSGLVKRLYHRLPFTNGNAGEKHRAEKPGIVADTASRAQDAGADKDATAECALLTTRRVGYWRLVTTSAAARCSAYLLRLLIWVLLTDLQ